VEWLKDLNPCPAEGGRKGMGGRERERKRKSEHKSPL
jgi:hypothetical protein